MNRTDRLLAIVLKLQARRQLRAEDLAADFEVSKRTIYRDVLALNESGVPVVSLPGQGYALLDGSFLPPLSFSTDEAITLLLGADLVAQNFDAQYRRAAQSASHKIMAVLPDDRRPEVEQLERSIRFIALHSPVAPDTLRQLRQAIIEGRRVRFRYQAPGRGNQPSADSQREADPYALMHAGGTWVLIAHCHLRRDRRHFRLDRIDDLSVLTQRFTRPPEFEIKRSEKRDRPINVQALFDHETARWVREKPSYFEVAQEQRPEGLLVTLAVHQPGDVLTWLLSWGAHVRVLEPESVRELLAREAAAMLSHHAGWAPSGSTT